MAKDFRSIQPDLVGYGKSVASWDQDNRLMGCTDEKLIEYVFSQVSEPTHIVAHSYGASIALELAARFPGRTKSLCLFEPVNFHLLNRSETKANWDKVVALGERIIEAVNNGNETQAANYCMNFWIGGIKWLFALNNLKNGVRAGMKKVADDFHVMHERDGSLARFERLRILTTIIVGGKSPSTVVDVAQTLLKTISSSRLVRLSNAGHMFLLKIRAALESW